LYYEVEVEEEASSFLSDGAIFFLRKYRRIEKNRKKYAFTLTLSPLPLTSIA